LAAATSTGGMVNKRPGRVGDTPVIGAGTFAWDQTVAVSCTGHGEPFIALGVAARISARMELLGEALQAATQRIIEVELPAIGGRGGLIAIDAEGRVSLGFNTAGMYRASQRQGEAPTVAIW
ncbi:MAG TPA: beta-aspartyl-peptidase, partial [Deltaproteobacteria bacterium]|nr:beta-aspartyl-peptidase [Deltaproteobacteria bacterium]